MNSSPHCLHYIALTCTTLVHSNPNTKKTIYFSITVYQYIIKQGTKYLQLIFTTGLVKILLGVPACVAGHENSTPSTILTSGFWCMTGGIFHISNAVVCFFTYNTLCIAVLVQIVRVLLTGCYKISNATSICFKYI